MTAFRCIVDDFEEFERRVAIEIAYTPAVAAALGPRKAHHAKEQLESALTELVAGFPSLASSQHAAEKLNSAIVKVTAALRLCAPETRH